MKRHVLRIFLSLLFAIGTAAHAADPLPKEVMINGVEFVHVPEGWFWHSVPTGKLDQDNHRRMGSRDVKVWQDGFYIAKYEVRARDFIRFMGANANSRFLHDLYDVGASEGCSVRRDEDRGYFMVRPDSDLAATHLSWRLADEMARWLGVRLPTEAEWVKAARGTDRRTWPWGDEYPDDTFAGYESGSECYPVPVNAFPNGRSPYGAYGMSGGVFEYVADWYNANYYAALKDGDRNPRSNTPLAARSDTTGAMADLRVLRGGRWASMPVEMTIHGWFTAETEQTFRCYGARFAVDEAEVRKLLAGGNATVIAEK